MEDYLCSLFVHSSGGFFVSSRSIHEDIFRKSSFSSTFQFQLMDEGTIELGDTPTR